MLTPVGGWAHHNKGQYDTAISDYNKAIEINPRDAWAYNNRGVAYLVKRQDDRAITDFTEAIELNPRLADAYNNRGLAYYLKDQYDKACSDWNRACESGLCNDHKWAKRKGVCS